MICGYSFPITSYFFWCNITLKISQCWKLIPSGAFHFGKINSVVKGLKVILVRLNLNSEICSTLKTYVLWSFTHFFTPCIWSTEPSNPCLMSWLYHLAILDLKAEKIYRTSTTPSSSGPIPAQKLQANSVPRDIFSHLMFEINFYYFHRFSWEKYTKMIVHMPWLYQ